jgi:hypothetical protein
MKTRVGVVAVLLLPAVSALGWLITPWSYEDLFAKSDFVVIASPLTRPRDTNERVTWQDITPPVSLVGVTTQFQTLLVLKGPKVRRFGLHHYREANPRKPDVVVEGGPGLVTFDPPKKEKGYWVSAKRYLLFLVREKDSRFAPVSGQRDPREISVQEVSGVTVDD